VLHESAGAGGAAQAEVLEREAEEQEGGGPGGPAGQGQARVEEGPVGVAARQGLAVLVHLDLITVELVKDEVDVVPGGEGAEVDGEAPALRGDGVVAGSRPMMSKCRGGWSRRTRTGPVAAPPRFLRTAVMPKENSACSSSGMRIGRQKG
jgi:hypothetical protein